MLDYLGVACVCEDKATVPSQSKLSCRHGNPLTSTGVHNLYVFGIPMPVQCNVCTEVAELS